MVTTPVAKQSAFSVLMQDALSVAEKQRESRQLASYLMWLQWTKLKQYYQTVPLICSDCVSSNKKKQ